MDERNAGRQLANRNTEPAFGMTPTADLAVVAQILRPLDVHYALLTCRHALAYWTGKEHDRVLGDRLWLSSIPSEAAQHFATVLARQIVLHCRGGPDSPIQDNDQVQVRVIEATKKLWQIYLDDPLISEVRDGHVDLIGFLARYGSIQRGVLESPLQHMGLFMGLYTNDMGRGPGETIDIPAFAQDTLGLPPEQFLAGCLVGWMQRARRTHTGARLNGTITAAYLKDTLSQSAPWLSESWPLILERVSCTPTLFAERTKDSRSSTYDPRLDLYHLNLLRRYPLIEVSNDEWVAPVPDLLVSRAVHGLYFDLLETKTKGFSEAFGYRIQNLVGSLASTSCGKRCVIEEKDWPSEYANGPPSKNADVVILGNRAHVLVECKSLRPTRKLLELGDNDSVDDLINRLTGAVEQIVLHAESITKGEWTGAGIRPKTCVGIVVTFAEVMGMHGQLVRERIDTALRSKGLAPTPYLILSLDEFDGCMRLAEMRHAIDSVVLNLVESGKPWLPGQYEDALSQSWTSSLTKQRGQKVFDLIRGTTDERRTRHSGPLIRP